LKSAIEAAIFPGITGAAKSLKVADVVGAAYCQRDDMINGQIHCPSAALTAMIVAIEHILPHSKRDTNSGSFTHSMKG
jgi:hypothetical protein